MAWGHMSVAMMCIAKLQANPLADHLDDMPGTCLLVDANPASRDAAQAVPGETACSTQELRIEPETRAEGR